MRIAGILIGSGICSILTLAFGWAGLIPAVPLCLAAGIIGGQIDSRWRR